ncbi:lytic transglycosylase domain-containing protein [Novosphingobium sp. 1949]|uniref:Lytic transglycosylase domain-containing protein n=1 Tax=Novosphingobium organovorum TaxID=2930092 RepID=A0ABT0BJE1_9SPHN|nr:lytic transglycosylase domain-containing protein [Novosphingobium organovorum]MCJ2184936.1 lytic transglycosylase domain-containing protein [Novosphingobium organovorum]
MSETGPVGSGAAANSAGTQAQAREAIARAASATGVDFQYLMAQARLESGLDPSARAATSSAAGLFQFTNGTWLGTLDRHGANHGLSWVSDMIEGGDVSDAGLRNQILGLRYNADASALMAAELARDNRDELTGVLGREPDASELYLAHFLGASGARDFLAALSANPTQSAAALLPRAASANRSVFYSATGAPRSVGQVMDFVRTRVSSAMGYAGGPAGAAPTIAYDTSGFGGSTLPTASAFLAARATGANAKLGPIASEFQAARQQRASASSAAAPSAASTGASAGGARSMADTLRSAFGASGDALPANVQNAYGKLARFGL